MDDYYDLSYFFKIYYNTPAKLEINNLTLLNVYTENTYFFHADLKNIFINSAYLYNSSFTRFIISFHEIDMIEFVDMTLVNCNYPLNSYLF